MKRLAVILSLLILFALSGPVRFSRAQELDHWSLQVLESDAQHLLLELHLPTFAEETISLDGIDYQRLTVGDGWGRWGQPGQPMLPAYSLPIGLPPQTTPHITLLEAQREVLPGYNLYPNPTFVRIDEVDNPKVVERFVPDEPAYQVDASLPGYLTEAADRGAIREQALFRLRLYPFQYNPARQELTVVRRLKVLVTFTTTSLAATSQTTPMAPVFHPLLAQTLVNFEALALVSSAENQPKSPPLQGLSGNTNGDYVIITHPNFYEAIQGLAAYRAAQGFKVVVVQTNQIYDQYSSGQKKPEAIRDYLADAYENWPVKPVYVLLVGDGNASAVITDPNNSNIITGYADVTTDYVPSHYESLLVFGPAPLDVWYTKVTQTNGVYDDDPDLLIGRIPARSVSDVTTVFNKIQAYEQASPTGSWSRQAVLVADDNTPNFAADMDTVAGFLPTNITPLKIYSPELDVETELNSGALLVAYSGHGSTKNWGRWAQMSDFFYQISQIPNMSNANKYPFLTVANCSNGYFSDPTNNRVFAEEFLLVPNKGGVATWAAAAYSFPSINTQINEALYRAMFADDTLTLSAAAIQALVEAHAENWFLDRNLFESYTFFGDPALRLAVPVDAPPAASFVSSSPDKLGQLTAFTNFSAGVGNSYSWNFGDGATSTQKNPSHTYANEGHFTVTLTVTNAQGTDVATASVQILPADATISSPTASFTSSSPDQLGQPTVFVNTSQDGGDVSNNVGYVWEFGDGMTSLASNPTHVYGAVGTYNVRLTITNSVGNHFVTGTVTIIESPLPLDASHIFLPIIIK